MIDQNIAPDVATIKQHLHHITRRWHEVGQDCLLEMVFLSADDRAKVRQVMHYTPDSNGIDMAASDAETWNKANTNVYATVNPVDASNRPEAHKRASASHILGSFFHWADADDDTAAQNIKAFVGPKSTFYVLTGTKPGARPHVYWELEDFTRNLPEWERTQKAIAATLKTDSSVTDPPRIMRLAGTVNWPKPQKQAKGYVAEIVSLHIYSEAERPPVTSERMARAFPGATAAQSGGLQIDTGSYDVLDREREAIKALSGENWNIAVFKLVGSYVRKGLSDSEIIALTEPLTLSGYTIADTHTEVQAMIDRTRANPNFEGVDAKPEPLEATPQVIADFRIDSSADFLADLQPLEYLIDGILPTGVVYSLTGHAGHGKTTLALQLALSVALGEDFHGRDTSKGSVLILAGENPYNVKWQYAAALAARDINPRDVDVHFVQGRFSIDQWTDVIRAKMAAMPNLKLVIVDSLQAFFEGDNDNDNSQMVTMAHKIRQMVETPSRPAMLVIAHPAGKTPSKDNLVPRGGGAFLNEIDGNLTIWSQDASQQTLHHSQKFRGAGFDPLEWVMQIHEFDHLTDIHGTPLKLPVSRPELTIERANREQKADTFLRQYLETVADDMPLSVREMSSRFQISRYRAEQTIATARDEKLIKRYAKTYKITDGGKAFLEANDAGV